MMKKIWALLAVVIVIFMCFGLLTACGGSEGDETASKNVQSTDVIDTDDDSDELDDDDTEEDDSQQEQASVKHTIDDAEFYTVHEVDEWIEDGVFDFEDFADDFGIEEKEEESALHMGSSDFYIELIPGGEENKINAFGVCRGGVCNVEVIDVNPEGREVKLDNGYKVPYELLEIGLYMVEFAGSQRVDYEKPVALDWLYDVGLSEDFEIMFWQ